MDPEETVDGPDGINVEWGFDVLMTQIVVEKPNDRSDRDRYYAILKTEIEKARAIYEVYCKPKD